MAHILVIDDEMDICRLIEKVLGRDGHTVSVRNSAAGLEASDLQQYDLLILDIMMPEVDGFSFCYRMRRAVDCPILFLTAKIEEADRIKGLMLGGDDYILKPFSIEELGARVEAHLRREERRKTDRAVKIFDRLAVHYGDRCVYYDKEPIGFTKTEYGIVEMLSLNAGQVFSKEQLYEKVRGFDGSADSGIVMEHVRRIRSKIGKYTDHVFIETVWGVGYRWTG